MVTTSDTPVKKTIKTPRKKAANMHESMDSCPPKACCRSMHKVRGTIAILLLLANLGSIWYTRYNGSNLEIIRNGGRENYEKMMKFMQTDGYKNYMTQSADAMIMQLEQTNTQPINTTPTENNTGKELDESPFMLNEAEENSDI